MIKNRNDIKVGDLVKAQYARDWKLVGHINELRGVCDCCTDKDFRQGVVDYAGNIIEAPK